MKLKAFVLIFEELSLKQIKQILFWTWESDFKYIYLGWDLLTSDIRSNGFATKLAHLTQDDLAQSIYKQEVAWKHKNMCLVVSKQLS